MTSRIVMACALLALPAVLLAERVEPSSDALSELDAVIEAYMEDNNVPGAQVAVASRGRILELRNYGLADVEHRVPVTADTVFEIGSISKQFVTAAVMLLHEQGRIGLDDGIHEYLPYLPSEWVGVTVRQLMTHTSGIPDYEEIRTYDVYRYRLTPEEVIRIGHSRPMDFAPGTGYYYSNTGYFLLSMIVERIAGQPLGQYLDENIFGPLGMSQTRMSSSESIIPNRASGYWVDRNGDLINRMPTETSSTLGAGGLLSSARDLATWDEALYGTEFLSAASKAAMWQSVVLPNGVDTEYGFGWRVTPYLGMASQSHGGQVAGFVTRFARYPESETAIIVFMNRYRVSSTYLARAVLHTFMPSLGPVPE